MRRSPYWTLCATSSTDYELIQWKKEGSKEKKRGRQDSQTPQREKHNIYMHISQSSSTSLVRSTCMRRAEQSMRSGSSTLFCPSMVQCISTCSDFASGHAIRMVLLATELTSGVTSISRYSGYSPCVLIQRHFPH
mmetsp:Transcript_53760/g.85979  ORF Transcript_53760/g.85979 Transcript_53760/m.85979 type:complete len:135 (+) Transcript_53760:111-515(+)